MPGTSALTLNTPSSSVISTAGDRTPDNVPKRVERNGVTPKRPVNVSNNRSISLLSERQTSGVSAGAGADCFTGTGTVAMTGPPFGMSGYQCQTVAIMLDFTIMAL